MATEASSGGNALNGVSVADEIITPDAEGSGFCNVDAMLDSDVKILSSSALQVVLFAFFRRSSTISIT